MALGSEHWQFSEKKLWNCTRMKMQLQNDLFLIVVGYHSRAPMMTKQPYRCLTLISCSSILLSTKVSNKAHRFGQYRALWKLLKIEITLKNWSGMWVVKILTWGYQISFILSKTWIWPSTSNSWNLNFRSPFLCQNHLY